MKIANMILFVLKGKMLKKSQLEKRVELCKGFCRLVVFSMKQEVRIF